MPELPEVQIVINELSKTVLNKKILDINIINPKILKNSSPKEFCNFLINEKIKKITRLGKYIIFHLTNKKILVSHLRMEGKYYFESAKDEYDKKHVLIKFIFSKYELRYHDTRRFGTLNIYNETNYLNSKELKKIALDPLDKNFDSKYLFKNIHNFNRAIKTILLDQTKVSGIGNIYADEILFASNIHPLKPSNQITENECKLLVKNSKIILKDSIANNGTTIASYKFKKNHTGSYQEKLKVHTKVNNPCPRCKTKIVKIKVNGRGTYYCPKCQIL
ncbi:DNA-formamidopyrimidine glycosylase [Mycoplasmoides pirum]|uniref:DNA-formamidopyrimidine glycosylase n=1 Tax=Mycoplasmoides pirum TaxID=2122 RepID=UPI00047F3FB7|nr:DNA-formamidopyrimidine glycosylase [Mycoplasmoides pirum]